VTTDVTPKHVDELRTIALAAADLVDDLDGQRAREDAAFQEGYRLAFEAGREVGYAQAQRDMEKEWSILSNKLVNDTIKAQRAAEAREEFPKVALPCEHPGTYCDGSFLTDYRVDRAAVRCHKHQPVKWCEKHKDNDRCRYAEWLKSTLRPEFMGTQAPWRRPADKSGRAA
jgi:hypothetical protein